MRYNLKFEQQESPAVATAYTVPAAVLTFEVIQGR